MILQTISNYIVHVISGFGYAGIAFLMAIESAAIPLPSEVIMPFSGFLVSVGRFSLIGIALAGAIGSVIGSVVLYYIGAYGGRPLIEKYGSYILMNHRDLEKADRFFNKYGDYSNLLGRVLPIVRTFISFPAGIARVNVKRFIIDSFIGSFIWSLFLGWIGIKLGQHWDNLKNSFHQLDLVLGLLILIGLGYFIYRHIAGEKQAR